MDVHISGTDGARRRYDPISTSAVLPPRSNRMPLASPVAERSTSIPRSAPPPRLRAYVVAPHLLDAGTRDAAFALFRAHYEGADQARFEHDLSDKQRVILLRDRD